MYEELAISYYERSGSKQALNSLASILWKQGQKERSMEIFKSLKTTDGQLNYLIKCVEMDLLSKEEINKKIRSLIDPECSAEDLGKILITLYINGYEDKKFLSEKRKEFDRDSKTMPELDRIFIQAWLAYVEGNYEKGYLHASKLILKNVYVAENILVLLEKKLREEGNADISSSEESEDISSGDSELEESPPNLKKPSDGDHEKQEEKTLESCLIESPNEGTFSINNNDGKSEETFSSSPSSSEKKLSSERRREKQEKRIKKESEKNKRKALKLMELYLSSSSSSSAFDKTTQQEIRYSFNNNKKLEEEFNRLKKDDKKFQELLEDIQERPWETVGGGKPKILHREWAKKHLKDYLDNQGPVISRRIDHKKRFVYQVGRGERQGEIIVYAVSDHYDD